MNTLLLIAALSNYRDTPTRCQEVTDRLASVAAEAEIGNPDGSADMSQIIKQLRLWRDTCSKGRKP